MRQRLNPWVVVLTAALTFGSLMALVGPRSFGHHGWGHRGYYGHQYQYNHGSCDSQHADRSTDKGDSSLKR
ncbi:hypothetical protein EXU85_11350 [Spirosoma sp. KCTC 42546]|uniref:hypothetical protein n=1 Tax=Spirosoma sp. KCTC 42546 TaxID=2520506 RepID=UPI00115BDD60|nr:hypothetical protein [Spirosoma sp. KCTC 42546]QDK79169.1 hypothetical protein EXU85_11350 [Spirosoma sp. KCTC 42546]